MEGSATVTMLTSSSVMNSAETHTVSAFQRRGSGSSAPVPALLVMSRSSDGAGPAAPADASGGREVAYINSVIGVVQGVHGARRTSTWVTRSDDHPAEGT